MPDYRRQFDNHILQLRVLAFQLNGGTQLFLRFVGLLLRSHQGCGAVTKMEQAVC
jgi:hypothetical protein